MKRLLIACALLASCAAPPTQKDGTNIPNLNETGDWTLYLRATTPEGCKVYSTNDNSMKTTVAIVICSAGFTGSVAK